VLNAYRRSVRTTYSILPHTQYVNTKQYLTLFCPITPLQGWGNIRILTLPRIRLIGQINGNTDNNGEYAYAYSPPPFHYCCTLRCFLLARSYQPFFLAIRFIVVIIIIIIIIPVASKKLKVLLQSLTIVS